MAAVLAAAAVAHADDDPGQQLMMAMMRAPAMSADGKHVALYSMDPGGDAGAKTSLAVFDAAGKLEQRISVVPPAVDAGKARAAAGKLVKLLDDGGYKRMGRVARKSGGGGKDGATQLASGDATIDVRVVGRDVEIRATVGGKALAPIKRPLGGDGPCGAVDGYNIANTTAGYDAASRLFAFSVTTEHAGTVCFGHDVVVALK